MCDSALARGSKIIVRARSSTLARVAMQRDIRRSKGSACALTWNTENCMLRVGFTVIGLIALVMPDYEQEGLE